MECRFTNYKPTIKERLPEQFKYSTSINGTLESFIDDALEKSQCDVITKRWLNTAVGKQLDGVGEIVGYARPKGEPSDEGDFGFDGDDTSRTFGSTDNEIDGGFLGTAFPVLITPVNDDTYRILLKAKILRNNSDLDVDSTLEILSTLFDAKVSYFLLENLQPMYEIGREFFLFEREILKIFPTTLCIKPVIYASYSEEGAFGFNDDDLGFADTVGTGQSPSDDLLPSDDLFPLWVESENGGYLASVI